MAEATNQNKIIADVREKFGKGAARKLRVLGKIPAVIYGHGTTPVHVALPAHQIGLLLRRANAVLDLDINGKSHLTLVKDVQKDPFLQIIEHIDLIIIRKGEKVQVEISVHLTGEPASGMVADLDTKTLLLEVEATSIPQNLAVNIDGLEDGDQIRAKDVILPKGATLVSDEDAVVVLVRLPVAEEEEEAAEGDAEAAAE
jgi:large subunit ribosomal protein L25